MQGVLQIVPTTLPMSFILCSASVVRMSCLTHYRLLICHKQGYLWSGIPA